MFKSPPKTPSKQSPCIQPDHDTRWFKTPPNKSTPSRSDSDIRKLCSTDEDLNLKITQRAKRKCLSSEVSGGELDSFKNDIKCMIKEMMNSQSSRLDKLEHHMLELKNHSTEIKTTHSELEKAMSSISDQIWSLEKTITSLEKERSSLVAKVMSLEDKLEFLDRNQIKTSIEIRNVPKRTNETKNMLYDMISNLSQHLDIVTESAIIRDVSRQPSKKDTSSSNVTVEFSNTLIKANFLNAVKDFNKKNSTNKTSSLHLGIKSTTGTPIYIAELLTPYTKRLFYAARTYAKLNKYSYCWTSNGRVMLKKDSDSQSILVKSELQLQQLGTNKQP